MSAIIEFTILGSQTTSKAGISIRRERQGEQVGGNRTQQGGSPVGTLSPSFRAEGHRTQKGCDDLAIFRAEE